MSGRRIGRGVRDVLLASPFFLGAPLVRRWHLRWGATDDEVRAAMPGDEIVPRASLCATRAVTIDSPPADVWPWIVQVCFGKAGFYSYDLVDNGGRPSAERIIPEWQHVAVGDWMPMAATVNETTALQGQGLLDGRMATLGEAGKHLGLEVDALARGAHSLGDSAQAALRLEPASDGDCYAHPPGVRRLRHDAAPSAQPQSSSRAAAKT